MDILNNIWNTISTPNEGIINALMIIATFIEAFLSMHFFLNLLNINSQRKERILYVLLISILALITLNIFSNPFNVFLNYFIMILLIILLFKTSILKSIIATASSTIIIGLIGSLFSNPYLSLFKINSDQMTSIPIYRFGFLLILYTFLSLIILIIKYRKISLHVLEDLDKRTRNVLLINILVGLITLIIHTIILLYYIDLLPVFLTFLSFVSLIGYFGINIFSLTRVMKLTLTTRKLESAEAYNNTLQILHDNVRGFKHDFDNIVTIIGGYIKTNDMDGLKSYYSQLEDDCQKVNNLYILNPSIVNNDGVYNLITKKYNEAESKGIKVNISFLLDLSTLNMKIYEFSRILGILLDNAIEASSNSEEKVINLTFRNDTKNKRQLIIIENSYSNKNVNTDKIFEKGITEKENHNGLGLWEVRKIISKNNQVNLYTTNDEKLFTQQLEIYY